MTKKEIQYLFAYTNWANDLILTAAESLDPAAIFQDRGVSHKSIHGTLLHMLYAEWVWLRRFQHNSPAEPLAVSDFPDLAAIRKYWRQIESERATLLEALTDEALAQPLTYTDLAGQEYHNPLGLLLQHVVNHATLHRGQVMAMIRQLGIQPPATDFVFFFRR